jgi:hypothetical protein
MKGMKKKNSKIQMIVSKIAINQYQIMFSKAKYMSFSIKKLTIARISYKNNQ